MTAFYTKTVENLGEVTPTVEVASVEEKDDTAVATLSWSWPVGPEGEEWTYDSQAELVRSADDRWEVTWKRKVVEPSLTNGTVLDLTPIAPRRGDITGAGGLALVTARPVVRVGLDKGQIDTGVQEAARAMAELVDIDVAPYVALAKAAGDKAFVEAIVYRRDEVPAAVTQGLRPDPRRPARLRRHPARPHPRLRGADPRHRRRGHRRDDQGAPGPLRDRRRGRAVGAAGALRRASCRARPARW